MAATPGTTVASGNANTQTNTSLTITLATTTVGELNVIEITGDAAGTGNAPTGMDVSGWVKVGEKADTNAGTGSSSSFVAVFYRVVQSGDPSTVTATWTNAGQMVAIVTPWTGFDPVSPVPYSVFAELASSTASYVISGTTGSDVGVLCYGAANRTGSTAWTGLSDTARGQTQVSTAGVTMVARYVPGDTAAGTAFTKSMTGTSTSIGVSWAYVVKSSTAAVTGSIALSGSGTLTAVGVAAQPGVVGLAGSGSLTVVQTRVTTSGTVAFAGSGTLTASSATPVDLYLADQPFYAAHRGGSDDWVESTMYAYGQAHAWGVRGLEVSCWRTSDGVWVASHDPDTGHPLRAGGIPWMNADLNIASNTWATLSALRTTVGGYPMARLSDVLAAYASSHIIFADNKSGVNNSEFLDLLDTYSGPGRAIVKMFYTATSLAGPAHARGYKTWGYYYDTDVSKSAPNLASTQANYDVLGMDYLATSASWTAVKSYGKPVMAHIVDSAAAKSTALGFGANGMMVSKVTTVVPYSGATLALSGSGTLTAAGKIAVARSLALSGSGTLTAVGSTGTARTGTVSLTGSGTLTAAGVAVQPPRFALAPLGKPRTPTVIVAVTAPSGRWAFLDALGRVSGLSYSWTYPGGPSSADWSLDVPPGAQIPALTQGSTVAIYRGTSVVWSGRVSGIDRGTPWRITADGKGSLAVHEPVAITGTLDAIVDQAITNGLPWTRPASLSTTTWSGDNGGQDVGTTKLDQVLTDVLLRAGRRWTVNTLGAVSAVTDPTTVSLLAQTDAMPPLALGQYASEVTVRYQSSSGTYLTVRVANATAAARFGRVAASLDMGASVMTATDATTAGQAWLDRHSPSMTLAGDLALTRGQLTTATGADVDLPAVKPGVLARIAVLPYMRDALLVPSTAIDVIVGQTTYNVDDATLTFAPVNRAPSPGEIILGAAA